MNAGATRDEQALRIWLAFKRAAEHQAPKAAPKTACQFKLQHLQAFCGLNRGRLFEKHWVLTSKGETTCLTA